MKDLLLLLEQVLPGIEIGKGLNSLTWLRERVKELETENRNKDIQMGWMQRVIEKAVEKR